jgi:hypothetical protein
VICLVTPLSLVLERGLKIRLENEALSFGPPKVTQIRKFQSPADSVLDAGWSVPDSGPCDVCTKLAYTKKIAS